MMDEFYPSPSSSSTTNINKFSLKGSMAMIVGFMKTFAKASMA
jgi:hypothetical protein